MVKIGREYTLQWESRVVKGRTHKFRGEVLGVRPQCGSIHILCRGRGGVTYDRWAPADAEVVTTHYKRKVR